MNIAPSRVVYGDVRLLLLAWSTRDVNLSSRADLQDKSLFDRLNKVLLGRKATYKQRMISECWTMNFVILTCTASFQCERCVRLLAGYKDFCLVPRKPCKRSLYNGAYWRCAKLHASDQPTALVEFPAIGCHPNLALVTGCTEGNQTQRAAALRH